MIQSSVISQFNREIAFDYGEKIFQKHLKDYYKYCSVPARIVAATTAVHPSAPSSKKWYQRVWSWVNPWRIGQALGWGIGVTHGQQITNTLVEKVAEHIFREEIAQTQKSGWNWFKRDVAQPAIVEAAKLTFTPILQPFVLAGLHFIGGLVVAAAFAAIAALYNFLKNRKKKELVLGNIYDLTLLIQKRNNALFIGKEQFEENDLQDLLMRTYEYLLCQELMKLPKGKVGGWINKHVIKRSDNVRIFSDGDLLTPAKRILLAKAKSKLENENRSKESKKIRKVIHLLAKHKARHIVKQIVTPSGPFIQCSDQRVCAYLPRVSTCMLISNDRTTAMREKTDIIRLHNRATRWALS